MPKVMPVGTGELSVRYRNVSDDEEYFLVLGVDPSGDPDASEITSMLGEFIAEFEPLWSSSYTFTGWELRYQDTPTVQEVFTGVLTATGDETDPVDKQSVCLLIHKRTAITGRVGRGRMFLSGVINATATDGGVLTAGAVTAWNTALGSGFIAFASNGYPMVLFHDVDVSHPVYATATPVTSLEVDQLLATQRRRLRR